MRLGRQRNRTLGTTLRTGRVPSGGWLRWRARVHIVRNIGVHVPRIAVRRHGHGHIHRGRGHHTRHMRWVHVHVVGRHAHHMWRRHHMRMIHTRGRIETWMIPGMMQRHMMLRMMRVSDREIVRHDVHGRMAHVRRWHRNGNGAIRNSVVVAAATATDLVAIVVIATGRSVGSTAIATCRRRICTRWRRGSIGRIVMMRRRRRWNE